MCTGDILHQNEYLISHILGHNNWIPGKKYIDHKYEIFYLPNKCCYIFDKHTQQLFPSPQLAYFNLVNIHQFQKFCD